jgi:hypothetical protein
VVCVAPVTEAAPEIVAAAVGVMLAIAASMAVLSAVILSTMLGERVLLELRCLEQTDDGGFFGLVCGKGGLDVGDGDHDEVFLLTEVVDSREDFPRAGLIQRPAGWITDEDGVGEDPSGRSIPQEP